MIRLKQQLTLQAMDSVAEFQKLCHQCCFSTNNQTKRNAQLLINQFVGDIHPANLQQILLHRSQTAVFVVCEYIAKNAKAYPDLRSIVQLLVALKIRWVSDSNVMIRNGEQLPPYVSTSLSRAIGALLKFIFREDVDARRWVYEFIESLDQRLQLLVWKCFIECVDQIDQSIGFLSYRNLVYAFQDEPIARIIRLVLPYFQKLTQSVRFNQLSDMQSKLSVNQQVNTLQKRTLVFSSQQLYIADLVLELIRLATHFRYNITYCQYQMQNNYQNSTICYPQKVKQILIKSSFYQSMFFLAERLILEQPESALLTKCLNCLQKIVLCRISYDKKQNKKQFTFASLRGITKLMGLPSTPEIYSEFVNFNRKMISNILLKKFRKFEPTFTNWLTIHQTLFLKCIDRTQLNYQDQEFKEAVELQVKILEDMRGVKLVEYQNGMRKHSQILFNAMCRKLLTGNVDPTKGIAIRNVKHLKTISGQFLQNVKIFFSASILQSSQGLANAASQLFNGFVSSSNNPNQIANLILLLSELISGDLFSMNFFRQEVPLNIAQIIGRALNDTLKFVQIYVSRCDHRMIMLDGAILIFMERLLMDTLSSFSIGGQKPNYRMISNGRVYNSMGVTPPGQPINQFVQACFTIILGFMKSKDNAIIQFSMQVLNTCLTKLKWTVSRQIFKQMQLSKAVFTYCLELAKRQFVAPQSIKCRLTLFKIITVVGFDDCLDSYREKLTKVFDVLNFSINHPNILVLIYDLRGIASQIDTGPVYRFFLSKAIKLVKVVLDKVLADTSDQKLILMKQSLKLCRVLVQNKSQRLTLTKTVPLSYSLFNSILPFWATVLQQLNKQTGPHDLDIQIPLAYQIYKMFSQMMRCNSYINFYLLRSLNSTDTDRFIVNIMRYICIVYKNAHNYPKFYESYLLSASYIIRDLSEFIFSFQDKSIIEVYAQVFQIVFKLMLGQLKQISNGNYNLEKGFDKTSQGLISGLNYIRTALVRIHKQANFKSAQMFKSLHYVDKLNMIGAVCQSLLENPKGPSIQSNICRIINQMMSLYPESLEVVNRYFVETYGPSHDLTLLKQIYETCQGQKGKNYDSEVFSGGVSEWLKSIDRKARLANTLVTLSEY